MGYGGTLLVGANIEHDCLYIGKQYSMQKNMLYLLLVSNTGIKKRKTAPLYSYIIYIILYNL